jgi:hypothetical protein
MEFTLGVGFGHTPHSAATHLLQALATPFADQREKYVSQWQRARAEIDLSKHTKDGGSILRLSQCLLLAHEDKTYQGAFVASLSIPWGDTKDDSDRGGYHRSTRDMVHRDGVAGGGQTSRRCARSFGSLCIRRWQSPKTVRLLRGLRRGFSWTKWWGRFYCLAFAATRWQFDF